MSHNWRLWLAFRVFVVHDRSRSRGLSRAALAGCSGWDSLFFGIVDAVVTVTDVLVGGQEGRPMLAWVRTAIRKEGLKVA